MSCDAFLSKALY